MKRFVCVMMLVLSSSLWAAEAEKAPPMLITESEVKGVAPGTLNMTQIEKEFSQRLAPIDDSGANWKLKSNETLEEIIWW